MTLKTNLFSEKQINMPCLELQAAVISAGKKTTVNSKKHCEQGLHVVRF